MDSAKEQRQERDDGELGGERFCRRDANLGSGMHVNPPITLARDGAGDIVADPQSAMTLTLAFAQSGQGIRGLSALADDEDECVASHRQVAVSQLACELAFHRNMGKRLDEVLTNHGRMEGSATSAQNDSFDLAKFGIGHFQAAEFGSCLFNGKAPTQSVANRVRLLEDLLEHVMRKGALIDVLGLELYRANS